LTPGPTACFGAELDLAQIQDSGAYDMPVFI
jgi:hypothetical protein